MNKAEKELLRRSAHLGSAICHLEDIPDDDLIALRSLCYSRSTTNCGWLDFKLAPLLIREIDNTLSIRKAHAERIAPNTVEKQS